MSDRKRLPGWPERLAEYLATAAPLPFEWGRNDCVTFAAGAVEAITGRRPQMPAWTGLAEARQQLLAAGGLIAAVESIGLHALERVSIAQRGDVLLVRGEPRRRQFLAVCAGHVWATPGLGGLVYGPMSAALRGWKV